MNSTTGSASDVPAGDESLAQSYAQVVAMIDSAPEQVVNRLTEIQHHIASQALFSVDTETLDDISTSSLPLLLLEHYLAMAYTQLPTRGVSDVATRQSNLFRACDLWSSFLSKLESLEQLTKSECAEYHELMQSLDECNSIISNTDGRVSGQSLPMPPPANRDAKIARFQLKQRVENEHKRLESLRDRRGRLGLTPEEEIDGHDEEGLQRTLALNSMDLAKATSLEEWSSVLREMPMIYMMVKSQSEQTRKDDHYKSTNGRASENDALNRAPYGPSASATANGPLQVTHITQHETTGQLLFRRQDIRANVFRPGWNQPTMSLEELADREVAGALERDERQRQSEAYNKTQPRRIDQLRKDGLDDDADLVDASAVLDRQWDDFKDENPRGCGNKRGDVGDRNF